MDLPFFYIDTVSSPDNTFILDEATSKHMVQVLRMGEGEPLRLTDGKGNIVMASIKDANRKKCVVSVESIHYHQPPTNRISIAISLIKNGSRFEWFLEKATELGVTEIIPLLCNRTEQQHFRYDRMKNILVSAMLQSQQCWLPVLHEPTTFKALVSSLPHQQKFIAHCIDEEKKNLADIINEDLTSAIILIGPEGDFTKQEIETALQYQFIPVSLGATRLRTETAGVVAAVLLTQL